MRCLERNKKEFYYALYRDKVAIVDEYGNETGEYRIIYGEPIKTSGNISVAKGEAQTEIFGISTDFDRVIVIDDVKSPIKVTSIIFIGIMPNMSSDGNYNNNYIVKAVAESLNSVSIAISEVGSNEN